MSPNDTQWTKRAEISERKRHVLFEWFPRRSLDNKFGKTKGLFRIGKNSLPNKNSKIFIVCNKGTFK